MLLNPSGLLSLCKAWDCCWPGAAVLAQTPPCDLAAAEGTWQLGGKIKWKQGGFIGFLERRGQLGGGRGELQIQSSICLTFQKVNGLHSFELELVGWMYLDFWFQWYCNGDKDSVLLEAFVQYVWNRDEVFSLDLNMERRCLCPVPFLR